MYIYLSGGMTGMGDNSKLWRTDACDFFQRHNVKCFNPTIHYDIEETTREIEKEAMEYDLYNLRISDLVIVNFNNPNSLGTMAEIALAYEKRIPIIGLNEEHNELHPWLFQMTNKIFDDLEDMLWFVVDHYIN